MEMINMATMTDADRMAFEGAENFKCGNAPLIGYLGDTFYMVADRKNIEFGSTMDSEISYFLQHSLSRRAAGALAQAILRAFGGDQPMGEVAEQFGMIAI